MCGLQCDSLGRVFVLRYFGVLLAHQSPAADDFVLQAAGDASVLQRAVAVVVLDDEPVVQDAVAAELAPQNAVGVLAVLVVPAVDVVLVDAVVFAVLVVDAVVLAVPVVQNAAAVPDVVQNVAAELGAPALGDHGP